MDMSSSIRPPTRKCTHGFEDNGEASDAEHPLIDDEPTGNVELRGPPPPVIDPALLRNQNLASFAKCCATKK
jgi:hypothetical protein